jgi:hypothetical protein
VRARGVLAGLAAALVWLTLFALLGSGVSSHAWWTFGAGAASWLAALALARYGDRGVAVGVAAATGVGWAVAGGTVAVHWVVTGDWPLW